MKNKLVETGVNFCDKTVRNQLNETGVTKRKSKKNLHSHINKRKQSYVAIQLMQTDD